jgi:hypothetical protein
MSTNDYFGGSRPRQWQIAAEGFPIGPHDERFVIEAIETGRLTQGHVRPTGELKWRALDDHPPFAAALKWAGPTATEQPQVVKERAEPARSGTHPTKPAMWQVSAPGVPVGPHHEDEVVEMIESGQLFEGQVRRQGELRWMQLEEHPAFQQARLRTSTRASSRY